MRNRQEISNHLNPGLANLQSGEESVAVPALQTILAVEIVDNFRKTKNDVPVQARGTASRVLRSSLSGVMNPCTQRKVLSLHSFGRVIQWRGSHSIFGGAVTFLYFAAVPATHLLEVVANGRLQMHHQFLLPQFDEVFRRQGI